MVYAVIQTPRLVHQSSKQRLTVPPVHQVLLRPSAKGTGTAQPHPCRIVCAAKRTGSMQDSHVVGSSAHDDPPPAPLNADETWVTAQDHGNVIAMEHINLEVGCSLTGCPALGLTHCMHGAETAASTDSVQGCKLLYATVHGRDVKQLRKHDVMAAWMHMVQQHALRS